MQVLVWSVLVLTSTVFVEANSLNEIVGRAPAQMEFAYASFVGPVCGVIEFSAPLGKTVEVKTLGNAGLIGLDPAQGPYAYHSCPPWLFRLMKFM